MSKDVQNMDHQLLADIRQMIEHTRQTVSQTVNAGLTLLYWNIGRRINDEILEELRAEYGKRILQTLSAKLVNEFGNGFSQRNLKNMIDFAAQFPDLQMVVSLSRQLSWSHFILITPLKNDLQRDFYAQMCRIENWSVRTLQKKIDSMLFERTAISKKPEELAKLELQALQEEDKFSPDLVFRDPYILDFLNLKDTYSEKDLEKAILRELERFILELGNGFTFVERQKRMVIDGEDFYLDLLFYHRRLKRLIAIDLKIGKFKAAYKGQMELYLRWLEKNDMQPGEDQPIGLILCAEGNREQIELLQLDAANIKVSEYITQYLPQDLLKQKLHQFTQSSKQLIEHRNDTQP
ncbi:PDDEXK nuclease domain-containing protein [Runella sp.]|uniref:PDDEXK nuclease domain-containing protein n=1 Tax=Runella sp. TaxID=1960881 RepID=UPI003015936D